MLAAQTALAQSFSVKGTIISSEDNEPLIGATILQEGTTNGVATDVDGNFTIEVKGASKATLVVSYIGMVTKKLPVSAETKTLNVTLDPESKVVDEVVVVAYGVRKKGTIIIRKTKRSTIAKRNVYKINFCLQNQAILKIIAKYTSFVKKKDSFFILGKLLISNNH